MSSTPASRANASDHPELHDPGIVSANAFAKVTWIMEWPRRPASLIGCRPARLIAAPRRHVRAEPRSPQIPSGAFGALHEQGQRRTGRLSLSAELEQAERNRLVGDDRVTPWVAAGNSAPPRPSGRPGRGRRLGGGHGTGSARTEPRARPGPPAVSVGNGRGSSSGGTGTAIPRLRFLRSRRFRYPRYRIWRSSPAGSLSRNCPSAAGRWRVAALPGVVARPCAHAGLIQADKLAGVLARRGGRKPFSSDGCEAGRPVAAAGDVDGREFMVYQCPRRWQRGDGADDEHRGRAEDGKAVTRGRRDHEPPDTTWPGPRAGEGLAAGGCNCPPPTGCWFPLEP